MTVCFPTATHFLKFWLLIIRSKCQATKEISFIKKYLVSKSYSKIRFQHSCTRFYTKFQGFFPFVVQSPTGEKARA